MFRAIGIVFILWYLSSLFSNAFLAADDAITATFEAIETAANVSESVLREQ